MYIVDIKRTPVGNFFGALSAYSAPELTTPLFFYFLKKYPFLRDKTDEVILGNVLSAGIGMNPARIAAFRGGVNKKVPAYTINHVCASGMNAVIQGYRAISLHQADLILCGGMESMSQSPYLLKRSQVLRFGSQKLIDSLEYDGLFCSISNQIMGQLAENIAKKYKIKRNTQDLFALESHRKAIRAQKKGLFLKEIIEFNKLKADERPRENTSLKKLAALKPVFDPKGTVTAGNSSGINDGAALSLLASEKALTRYNLKPMARILDSVFVGLDPKLMGMGPKIAIEKLLKKNSLNLKDIDLFEINEAFAALVLVIIKALKIPSTKVNINGGAVAIGHPLGMSGARIIASLITALKQTKGRLGIASLCIGGGQGAAVLIENL